jgi:hypothetical protein
VLKAAVAPRDRERMTVTMMEDDVLEELRKELAKPRTGPPERAERKRPGKKDTTEGFHALPCADMTCPCRVIRKK